MRRQTLDGEAARDADNARILVGSVEEQLVVSVPADCLINLHRCHFFSDVWIRGNGAQGDVRLTSVDESTPNVPAEGWCKGLSPNLILFG